MSAAGGSKFLKEDDETFPTASGFRGAAGTLSNSAVIRSYGASRCFDLPCRFCTFTLFPNYP